ncbi:MAG: dicarboxylate/amino acid:cation symporter [Candidatus Hydrogenedentes bacterium]|nr:dicarboxylate/amino acid:cation symporter [Candidatus Hydrogenedentota bacterium]
MKRIDLHYLILIGMGIGFLTGILMHLYGDPDSPAFGTAVWCFDLLGKDLFVGGLKMIIAPLIFASIVTGVTSLPNMREIGAVGVKTLAYYFATTCIAVGIGMAAVLLVQPGASDAARNVREHREQTLHQYRNAYQSQTGSDPGAPENRAAYLEYVAQRDGQEIAATDFQSKLGAMQNAETMGAGELLRESLLLPILSNPFTALSGSPPNSLGIIFFALLTGIACLAVGAAAQPVADFFKAFNAVMMTITLWLMRLAPVCIGCIIASMIATLGVDALKSLLWYCLAVVGGIGAHICVLLFLVLVLGRMSPFRFLRGIRDAWLIAFTTTSSAATLPLTIHCTTKELKVSPKVANFTLPVGATVNMDGTALYEGVAVIFLLQMYGGLDDVPAVLGGAQLFIVFVTAVFAAIGAAAVPSAGLITMAIVASSVGLPLHYIFIIYAVDHLLDMFRTSTNVMGDMVGAVVVNRLERDRLGE